MQSKNAIIIVHMMAGMHGIHTVFPRIIRARSINFTVCVMRGLFEGALYSRAWSNSSRAVY